MKKNVLFFIGMLGLLIGTSAFLNSSKFDDPIDKRFVQFITNCPMPPPGGPIYSYGPCSPGRNYCYSGPACAPPEG